MTRFLLIDTGEALGPSDLERFAPQPIPLRLRLLERLPPFRDGEVIRLARLAGRVPGARELLLWRSGVARRLGERREDSGDEILGRIVGAERGETVFSLEKGLLAHLPPTWLPWTMGVLEALGKLRHPVTPSLYLGSAEAILARVREKYNRGAEAHRYSELASLSIEEVERELVGRYVKPGGRLLDIGCGAGREALGFARAGFRVVGIDIAPRMIEAARENAERAGLAIAFRVRSATELDEPPASFDGAFWTGSYYHVPGHALRVETLRRIARALAPDGVLILQVLYQARLALVSRARLVEFLRWVGRRVGGAWRLSEPGDGLMRDVSEASDPREACFFHEFSGPVEVRGELEAAGFRAEEVRPGWWVCRRAFP